MSSNKGENGPAIRRRPRFAAWCRRSGGLKAVRAEVGALADKITGGKSGTPATPLDGKFDPKYCVALGLHGHDASAADFREPCDLAAPNRLSGAPRSGLRPPRNDKLKETRCPAPISA